MLPGFRQGREYKRQLHQTIVGIPAAPGVEPRKPLVDRVVGVESAIEGVRQAVNHGTEQAAEAAAAAAAVSKAIPRIEKVVGKLQESHDELAGKLVTHMRSEEQAIAEMKRASNENVATVKQSVASVHDALITHAADDLRVAEEIRTAAQQANEHAAAARAAAEAGAEASRVAADIDQQVLAGQGATHERLDAISTAVGAEPEHRE